MVTVNAPDWIRVRVQIVDGPKRIRERTGRDREDVERVVGSRSSTRPYRQADWPTVERRSSTSLICIVDFM